MWSFLYLGCEDTWSPINVSGRGCQGVKGLRAAVIVGMPNCLACLHLANMKHDCLANVLAKPWPCRGVVMSL
jgi:hypothetical protein